MSGPGGALMSDTYRSAARKEWTVATVDRKVVKLGCLQRIADATEKMASNYVALQAERDYWRTRALDMEKGCQHQRRRIVALRGAITRLKKAGVK